MEDDKQQDIKDEVVDQEKIEIENSDNEQPGSTNEADPGGDVIIIK
jgi:hypothetical protein